MAWKVSTSLFSSCFSHVMGKTRKVHYRFTPALHPKPFVRAIGWVYCPVVFIHCGMFRNLTCALTKFVEDGKVVKINIYSHNGVEMQCSDNICTLWLHYKAVVGVHTHDRWSNWSKLLTRPLYQVFTYVIEPTVIWYGTSVGVFSFIVITNKIFINHGINRCMLVK